MTEQDMPREDDRNEGLERSMRKARGPPRLRHLDGLLDLIWACRRAWAGAYLTKVIIVSF